MLSKDHMTPQTVDTVCTEAVGFRIRQDQLGVYRLNMSVHMRSSDAIFGLGTDIPTFSFLYRLVLALIRPSISPIEKGMITITAMSSHIYSRHYDMAKAILAGGDKCYIDYTMPYCDQAEAMYLIAKRGKNVGWPMRFALTNWIMS